MHDDLTRRRIGVEIEYSNIALPDSCAIIQSLFGGVTSKTSRYEYDVKETSLGDFHLELDAMFLKKMAVDPTFGKISRFFGREDKVNDLIEKTAAKMIPYEVVAPPIPIADLDKIDQLVDKLRLNGALGTTHAFQYAFGVHLNVEPVNMETKTVMQTFQSFLMLQPWLERQTEVDITRKVSPFIESFEKDYLKLLMSAHYKPKKHDFIKDYISYNPSRNRILDMLPLFMYWDKDLVRKYLPDEKINARPTFHNRLPNCKIDLFSWNIHNEWRLWRIVELLAQDEAAFEMLRKDFLRYLNDIFSSKDDYLQRCHKCVTDLLSR
ncbi:MAG: amidoligase family protein [Campylobacterota bacterium]